MNDKKNISIIISAYMAQDFIDQCLYSINKQIYNNKYEILLSIDGCTDTLKKIEKIKNKYENIRTFWSETNCGPYLSYNTLVLKSNYELITFFGADDIMMDNFLMHNTRYIDNNSLSIAKFINFVHPNIYNQHETYNLDGVLVLPKSSFLEINGFEPWRCGADSDLLKRLSIQKHKIVYSNITTFLRRVHSNNITNHKKYGYGKPYRKNIINIIKLRKHSKIQSYQQNNLIEI